MNFGNYKALWPYVLLTVLCLPLFFVNVLDSHDWGGDFSQYITQAINIAEGQPQGETGYIYNPQNAMLAPPAYPVGYPLILSVVYLFAGDSIYAFEWSTALFILLLGLASFCFFKRKHTTLLAIILTLVLVYNPWMIRFKMQIRSDIPFAFFLLLFMLLYSRKSDGNWWQSLLIGMVGGFAISIRSIGIVLCFAVLFDLIQRWWQVRKGIRTEALLSAIQKPLIVAISAIGFYLLLSTVLFPILTATAPYPNMFTWDSLTETFALNVEYYAHIIAYFFTPRNSGWMTYSSVLGGLALLFLLVGMFRKFLKKFDWIDALVLLYMGVLLIFPYRAAGLRFILPLVPVFLLYIVKGIEGIGIGLKVKRTYVVIALGLAALLPYQYQLSEASWSADTVLDGPQQPYAAQFWHYIQHETADDARFVFIKPRVLAKYANRSAMPIGLGMDADEMEAQFRANNINYLVVHDSESTNVIKAYIAVKQPALIWENRLFKLYAFEE